MSIQCADCGHLLNYAAEWRRGQLKSAANFCLPCWAAIIGREVYEAHPTEKIDIYRAALLALSRCTFIRIPGSKPRPLGRGSFNPGTYAKRFVRDMQESDLHLATAKQLTYIRSLAWTYRRQIKDKVVLAWGKEGKVTQ